MPELASQRRIGQRLRLVVDVDLDWHAGWRDGLESYAGVVAELLAAHRWVEGLPTCAACTWAPTAVAAEERRRQHCEHQAALLPVVDVFPRAHDDVAVALLEAAAARVEVDQAETTAVVLAHSTGWPLSRIAGVLGCSTAAVSRRLRLSTEPPAPPVVHRVDGPPSDRGAA